MTIGMVLFRTHTLVIRGPKSWKPKFVVSFNMDLRITFTNIRQPMLKLKAHSGFHDLFRFLGILSSAHAPVHLTDATVVNIHVDELSFARILQHILCVTFSSSLNINYWTVSIRIHLK
jgi:hypothetical protein